MFAHVGGHFIRRFHLNMHFIVNYHDEGVQQKLPTLQYDG